MTKFATLRRQIPLVVLALLVALSFPVFCKRVYNCIAYPGQQNTTDMAIFAGAGKRYLATGQLYGRSDNYAITYAPGAGVYKFPPVYQLTVIPLLVLFPDEFSFLTAERVLQLALYLAACVLVTLRAGREWIWQQGSPLNTIRRHESLVFLLCAALVSLWSMGFFECFTGIEPETIIFFLLACCVYFHDRRDGLAGTALGFAAAIKIYPVLLLLAFLFPLRLRALGGFLLGLSIASVLSVLLVGMGEHLFYLQHILPVLLAEKPIYHIQNKTVEAFFNAVNILPTMSGTITVLVKSATLLSLFVLGAGIARAKPHLAWPYLLICTVSPLLCLANFWQQYHILLLLPFIGLLAYTIHRRSGLLALLLFTVATATSIQEAWYQDLLQHALASAHGERMLAYQIAHPSTNAPLLFFPHLWLLARLRDFVFLTPLALYLALAILLLIERNTTLREHAA